jgi:tRNA(Arg) A34 adenosine deaminase TadA
MGPPTAKLPSKRGKIDPIGTVVSQEEIVHLLLSFATPAPTMSSSSSSSLKPYDESCLRLAIAESQKAVDAGCMPFGAALADADGKILAQACNASQARKTRGGGGDVTRHAEMELIRKACSDGGVDRETFETCTLYSSTEPCVMCAGAIYWAGVSRVVYGASVQEMEKVSGPGGFDIPIEKLYSMGREGTRKIECVGPILCEEAMKVHKESGVWAGSNGSQANADIEVERSLFTSGLGSAAAAKAGDYSVPVIDMSTGSDAEIAEQLWQAATTVGFFSLTGHGIPQSDIDAAFGASAAFFAQSQSEKDAQSPFSRNNNAGYEYMSQVRPSTGTADQKESLQMTFRDGAMDGRWPSEPENFRSVAEGLAAKCHELAGRLMDLLESRACPNLKPGTLSKSHK